MTLVIREMHAAPSTKAPNEEWFVVENTGDSPIHTHGCSVAVGRGSGRVRSVGTLEPGFTLAPGEKVRVVSGNPAKKKLGKAPSETETLKNYYLFLAGTLLNGPGTVVAVLLKQHELARAIYDPEAKSGVGKPPAEQKKK